MFNNPFNELSLLRMLINVLVSTKPYKQENANLHVVYAAENFMKFSILVHGAKLMVLHFRQHSHAIDPVFPNFSLTSLLTTFNIIHIPNIFVRNLRTVASRLSLFLKYALLYRVTPQFY